MKRYLSHFSALRYWGFEMVQQYFKAEMDTRKFEQYLVLNPKDRFNTKEEKSFICTKKISESSLIINNGIAVVTPELMFLQLAAELDILQTIILANLLCAYPNGPLSEPLMRKEKLLAFANKAAGLHGRTKALRALQYTQNGAGSIMEVFVHMFLGLPHNLGGLGLKGGLFNYKIVLDKESSQALKQKNCYVDYCFPKMKIAYEYQGEYHNETVDHDSSRIMALNRMGYTVKTITKTQLYDSSKLNQLIHYIANKHKKRIQIRTDNFQNNFLRLRSLLPKNEDN
ncbi:MAG TPA: DUF559 domain-containing protein [Clostridiaceae bacterium]|nr:DUF559 domain-containing protein [Clostridiaceae bacterium]